MAGLTSRSTGAPDVRQAGLVLSRVFCVLTGGLLFVTTVAALIVTPFDLSTGDDLPHEPWNFFFAFNTWHHLLHLATSSLLLVGALRREWAPAAALAFGLIYVILAPAGWIDGNDSFDAIYNDTRENWVHTLLALQGVGFGGLGLWALAREKRDGEGNPRHLHARTPGWQGRRERGLR